MSFSHGQEACPDDDNVIDRRCAVVIKVVTARTDKPNRQLACQISDLASQPPLLYLDLEALHIQAHSIYKLDATGI